MRDQVAYLETQNLDHRGDLIANEVQHRLEDDGTANHYKARLGPYEHAIEIFHELAEQDGETLSLAAYFARVLQIKGLCSILFEAVNVLIKLSILRVLDAGFTAKIAHKYQSATHPTQHCPAPFVQHLQHLEQLTIIT